MKTIISWVLQIVAAVIMLQTLYFKFSGAEESIYIFSAIGMEPWGRYLTGVMELIAGVLLLTRKWNFLGAILGMGLMSGALFFHLTSLGVEVQGDDGYLFVLALVVLVSTVGVLTINIGKAKAFLGSLSS